MSKSKKMKIEGRVTLSEIEALTSSLKELQEDAEITVENIEEFDFSFVQLLTSIKESKRKLKINLTKDQMGYLLSMGIDFK